MRSGLDQREGYFQTLLKEKETIHELKAKQQAFDWNKGGISIGRYEAHLISFFLRQYQCLKVVEFGTLTGYSGLKILSALPAHGHLWTFELNPDYASYSSKLFEEAGFRGQFTMTIGKAEDVAIGIESMGPFDGVFIDANKSSYPWYLDWSYKNLKSGGIIIADNVLMHGVVSDGQEGSGESTDESFNIKNSKSDKEKLLSKSKQSSYMIQQLRNFNQNLMDSDRFDSIIIPTNEGLALAIKK